MPRRLVSVLQSEGLFNDATALVVFQAAIAATVSGEAAGAGTLLELVWAAVGAVLVGLAAAWLAGRLAARLTDPVAPSALTLVLPFAVYLAADGLSASGVIAVVVAALQTRQRASADGVEQRLTGGLVVPGLTLPLLLRGSGCRRARRSGARPSTASPCGRAERRRLETLRRRRDQWNRVQSLALAAARREVLAARSEPGVDPEVADRVLRRLDVRSMASLR